MGASKSTMDAQGNQGISRRGFLRGVGLAGLAAGGLCTATAVAAATGSADAAYAEESAVTVGNELIEIYGENVNLMPAYGAEWDVVAGPVGFESREIGADEITHTDQCDLLVIGGGISGTMAALKGAELGANVVVLEKMSKGRNTWESVGGCGSRMQAETGNVVDPAQYVEEILRASYWRARPDVVWSFVNNSGEAIDFMQDSLDKAGRDIKIYNTTQPETGYGIQVIQGEHKFAVPEDYNWTSWIFGPIVMDALTAVMQNELHIDLRFNTAGVQLVQDASGRVTGAVAKDADGYYAVEATKGVVLCTGGYEANPDMMKAWTRSEDYAASSCWDPSTGPTGDGHMMGLQLGAQMDPIPHAVMNFNFGTPAQFLDIPGIWFTSSLGIAVNSRGVRFVNEGLPMNFVSNAINAQPGRGKGCWIILNQGMVDAMADMQPTADETIKQYMDKGWMFKADTVADLAPQLGLDAAILQETVDTYNAYFSSAENKDLQFRRNLETAMPLAEGPYYGLVTNSTVLTVVGGLTIDESCRVLNWDDEPIEGLYAAGNASGGVFSGTYPRHLPATSVGRAATFGYVSARHAIQGE